MAAPILRNVTGRQTAFALGEFPGVVDARGEEASRIKATITINLIDRYTGEKFCRVIPYFTDDAGTVGQWVKAALDHDRTDSDINSFIRGRDGGR